MDTPALSVEHIEYIPIKGQANFVGLLKEVNEWITTHNDRRIVTVQVISADNRTCLGPVIAGAMIVHVKKREVKTNVR